MTGNAAVLQREKRTTAGTRMSSLVGQAVKDDDEFWSHSTWVEEEDASFHESDEGSDAQIDTFDSDFDDSEDDGENGNDEDGGEAEVLREEKRQKTIGRKKIMDVVNAGRNMIQKRKNSTQRKKALRGDGMNAGLVLNVPGSSVTSSIVSSSVNSFPAPRVKAKGKEGSKLSEVSATTSPERRSARSKSAKFNVSKVMGQKGTRSAAGTVAKRSLRTSTIKNSKQLSASIEHQSAVTSSSTSGRGMRKGKRKFTQEELILEAVQVTEAENERWLLSRKRTQCEENTRAELKNKLMMAGNDNGRKVTCKYNSKRGCYNTITFPSMDFVPEIFTRPRIDENARTLLVEQKQKDNKCVITGKKARYRDPKTRMGYHDLQAFKELRRRFDNGEELEQPDKRTKSSCPVLSDEVGSTKEQNILKPQKTTSSDTASSMQNNSTPAESITKNKILSTDVELPVPITSDTTIQTDTSQPSVANKLKNESSQEPIGDLKDSSDKCTKEDTIDTKNCKGESSQEKIQNSKVSSDQESEIQVANHSIPEVKGVSSINLEKNNNKERKSPRLKNSLRSDYIACEMKIVPSIPFEVKQQESKQNSSINLNKAIQIKQEKPEMEKSPLKPPASKVEKIGNTKAIKSYSNTTKKKSELKKITSDKKPSEGKVEKIALTKSITSNLNAPKKVEKIALTKPIASNSNAPKNISELKTVTNDTKASNSIFELNIKDQIMQSQGSPGLMPNNDVTGTKTKTNQPLKPKYKKRPNNEKNKEVRSKKARTTKQSSIPKASSINSVNSNHHRTFCPNDVTSNPMFQSSSLLGALNNNSWMQSIDNIPQFAPQMQQLSNSQPFSNISTTSLFQNTFNHPNQFSAPQQYYQTPAPPLNLASLYAMSLSQQRQPTSFPSTSQNQQSSAMMYNAALQNQQNFLTPASANNMILQGFPNNGPQQPYSHEVNDQSEDVRNPNNSNNDTKKN